MATTWQKVSQLFVEPASNAGSHVTDTNQRTQALTPKQEMEAWYGQSLNYSQSGARVTPSTILSIPAFYRAVEIIAGVLCSMPLEVFEEKEDGSIITDKRHDVAKLLNFRPSPLYTPYSFIETMILHFHIYGNFYAIIRKTPISQEITSLDIVADPTSVELTVNSRNEPRYRIKNDNGEISYNPDRILHIKNISFTGLVGEDTKELHKENFGLALAIRRYLSKFFGNGAHLTGILKSPVKLTQDIYDRLIKSWRARFGAGGSEEGGTAVLENGMEYQPISLSPNDSGTSDQRKSTVADISLITGVPRFMLEDSDPTFNNGETLTRQFVNYTILPMCERIQDEFNYKLFLPSEQNRKKARFNLSKLLSADTEQRSKYLDSLLKWGVITINEARKMEGMNPSSDEIANKHLVPVNMVQESPDNTETDVNDNNNDDTGN